MVKPASKKSIVRYLIETYRLSERIACRLVKLSRSGYRYNPKIASDTQLRDRMKALAKQYPRYGYLMLHSFLKQEGLVQNKKRTYRIYTEEGLRSTH